jgi:hypothetical protein
MMMRRLRWPALLAFAAAATGPSACKRGTSDTAPGPSTPPSTAAAAPTTTTTTLPPPVWRAARWGMTKDELLAAFPGEAQPLAAPTPFGPQTTGTAEAAIPEWTDGGVAYRVLFGFAASGLDRIYLKALKPTAGTCEDVEKALTAAHSAPADRHATGTSLRGEETTWKLADQTLTLGCSGVASLGYLSVTLDRRPPA